MMPHKKRGGFPRLKSFGQNGKGSKVQRLSHPTPTCGLLKANQTSVLSLLA